MMTGTFVSCDGLRHISVGVYGAQAGRFEYIHAARPALLRITAQQAQRLSTSGTALGLFDDRHYDSQNIDIAPRSLLIA
jgi:serine phosphatase RsbU (regulator of sigma subunit)